MVIRMPVEEIASQRRVAPGVKVMNLRQGDTVASLARINNKGGKKKRK